MKKRTFINWFNEWYDKTRNKVILDTITTPLWFGKKMKFPIKFRIKSNPDAFKPIKIITCSNTIQHISECENCQNKLGI